MNKRLQGTTLQQLWDDAWKIKIRNFHQDLLRENHKMITEEHLILIFLGKALTGHVISVHQVSSEIDCTRKCLSNPKCASFNFQIPQSRFLSICELNKVSITSSNNKLNRNDSFAFYEPISPMERPKQEIAAFCPTTRNIITDAATTQGTKEVSTTQDQTETPWNCVSSTQAATTAAPGRWFAWLP